MKNTKVLIGVIIVLLIVVGALAFRMFGDETDVDEGEQSAEDSQTGPRDLVIEFSRESTIASSSYELEDNTGYGFAYHASNVFDLDYSTSWCASESDEDLT
ncbi:MAG: hypothetical protein Q8P27_02515, partial [Candidatus Peregrinibacteria bacterium]|nr:hypothetical protein [Candidatus Peregrinibacteria bacterium]